MPFDFTTQPQSGGRVFDMGGQAFPGILTGKKKLPEIALAAIHKSSSSRRKDQGQRTKV
jgi:hypothetical protein